MNTKEIDVDAARAAVLSELGYISSFKEEWPVLHLTDTQHWCILVSSFILRSSLIIVYGLFPK